MTNLPQRRKNRHTHGCRGAAFALLTVLPIGWVCLLGCQSIPSVSNSSDKSVLERLKPKSGLLSMTPNEAIGSLKPPGNWQRAKNSNNTDKRDASAESSTGQLASRAENDGAKDDTTSGDKKKKSRNSGGLLSGLIRSSRDGSKSEKTDDAHRRNRPPGLLSSLLPWRVTPPSNAVGKQKSTSSAKRNTGPPEFRQTKKSDDASIDGVSGPLQRVVQSNIRKRDGQPLTAEDERKQQAYEEAKKIFDEGKFKQAERILKKIAKRKGRKVGLSNSEDEEPFAYNPLEEDALLLLAECQFQRKRYAWAQDTYTRLIKDYPSTRHMDAATRRLFKIARDWLGAPNFATTEDIQQVSLEERGAVPQRKKSEGPRSFPLIPNLFDRTRPVFDTQGRALQALRAIWMNDPTGPRADDALMLTASHFLRKGNYQEADRLFSILREEYPKSPHLQNAFLLGSHVKLMSYQGPRYDVKQLEQGRQLKESTIRLFPGVENKERLRAQLKKIDEAMAQRDWEKVRFYQRKNKPRAVAIYCQEILANYPQSSYAKRANEVLTQLGPQYSGERSANNIQPEPPFSNNLPSDRSPLDYDADRTGRARP